MLLGCYNKVRPHEERGEQLAGLLHLLLCLEFGVKGRRTFMSSRASVRIVGFKGGQRQSRKESQQAGRARRRLSSSMLMFNSHTLETQTRTQEMDICVVFPMSVRYFFF